MEVFWIGEVCNADWRSRAVTDQLRQWYATQTIGQAILSYEIKSGEE